MSTIRASSLRHVRPVVPLRFPDSEAENEHLGQTTLHFDLCAALLQILRDAVGRDHTVGADQFVYFNAASPRRCVAPDAFVKLGAPRAHFASWKTWERGVPELAVEILSNSDATEMWTLEEKLVRYHELGVRELIVFDADQPAGSRLRAFDRLDDDLVERVVEGDRTPCVTIDLHFVVAPLADIVAALRVARDAAGRDLIPTHDEAHRRADERIAELEAELRRR
ncbi:MAG: Uma2 family endonuclease [Labilithrix sp.]|nr:Uma2 family endonuclease [Labilithrix sp.]